MKGRGLIGTVLQIINGKDARSLGGEREREREFMWGM